MSYKPDMHDLEIELADLVPATLVAFSFIEAVFEDHIDGETEGGFQRFLIGKDTIAAATFALSDLRQRALRLEKILHGPDKADA